VRKDQVQGASGCTHRVGLDKPQSRNGSHEASGLEKATPDRVAAKLPETKGIEMAYT
jgi:hypothetical protein